MAVRATPSFVQAGSHPAEETRLMVASLVGASTGSFSGGVASADSAHGVALTSDLAVTANGTPNMSVNIAAGGAFIRNTESANGGAYHLWNDATLNLEIAAADATNARRDLVIAQVRDAAYSGASNDARIIVVTGTPAASPSDPSLSSYPNALVLARVAVTFGATSITSGNITDLRTLANVRSELPVVASTTARDQFIPSPGDGQAVYVNTGTASESLYFYNGTSWKLPWAMPWGVVAATSGGTSSRGYASTTSSSSTTTSTTDWSGLTVTFDAVNNRIYRTVVMGNLTSDNTTGSDYARLLIANTSNTVLASSQAIVQSGVTEGRSVSYVEAGISGSTVRKARVNRVSGAGNVSGFASSTFPASIIVEDIGPSGAPT